jgi:hypothetical protein
VTDLPGELAYDPETDQVIVIARTPERILAYDPGRDVMAELISGQWHEFPARREPEAGQ